MPPTLTYYNQNALQFAQTTLSVDFESMQNRFMAKLPPGALILDFGCGSGRDTKAFLSKGFQAEAIDGSEELCKIASGYTGILVKQMLFQELNETDKYDGIWACSSILHGVGDSDIPELTFVPVPNGTDYDEEVLAFCYYQAHKVSEIAEFLGITDSTYFRKQVLGNLEANQYLDKSKVSRAMYYKTNPDMVALS